MKKNDITNTEKFLKEFAKLYDIAVNMSELDIKSTCNRIKIWESIRNSHYENKPLKIFKKKYKEWEIKLRDFNNHIQDLYKQLECDIDEHFELLKN